MIALQLLQPPLCIKWDSDTIFGSSVFPIALLTYPFKFCSQLRTYCPIRTDGVYAQLAFFSLNSQSNQASRQEKIAEILNSFGRFKYFMLPFVDHATPMVTSSCWLHMGVRQTPFLHYCTKAGISTEQSQPKEHQGSLVCRMSSLPPPSRAEGVCSRGRPVPCTPSAQGQIGQNQDFPAGHKQRGAVVEIQLWQLTGRLRAVPNKQKSPWQLCHVCMQIIQPFGKTAEQVYLRLLKLMNLFLIIRRHAYTLHSFIIMALLFRFLP